MFTQGIYLPSWYTFQGVLVSWQPQLQMIHGQDTLPSEFCSSIHLSPTESLDHDHMQIGLEETLIGILSQGPSLILCGSCTISQPGCATHNFSTLELVLVAQRPHTRNLRPIRTAPRRDPTHPAESSHKLSESF